MAGNEHTIPSAASAGRASDSAWFRQVLGHYPTGVSAVTGIDPDGAPVGLAVGSFTSVSLEPPLVGFLPSVESTSWPKIRESERFCVNILAADQEPLCRAFAARSEDKFEGVRWRPAPSGSPILDGVVAWIDCHLHAVHEAGDHLIVLGEVQELHLERPTLPLLFFQGGYGRFSTHSLALGDARFGFQLQLVDSARTLMEALSQRTGAQVVAVHCDARELTVLASAGSPTDARVPSAAIGQRLPMIPPVGIWWMAFAEDAVSERWLEHVKDRDLHGSYRDALERIRQSGFCVGPADIESRIETIISARSSPGHAPTAEEWRAIAELTADPLDYVPAAARPMAPGERPAAEVLSVWAPAFSADGEVALGLMLSGFPRGGRPPEAHAGELLELARAVATLASS